MPDLNKMIRVGFFVVAVGAGIAVYYTSTPQSEMPKDSIPVNPPVQEETSNRKNSTESVPTNNKRDIEYPAGTVPVSSITADLKGKKKSIAGTIVDCSSGKGHNFYIIRDINSDDRIKVVLFNAQSEHPDIDNILNNSWKKKTNIKVVGKVSVYKGETDMVVESAEQL